MAFPFPDPTPFIRLGMRSGAMLAEAQTVIAMRSLGMFGFWNMRPSETARMVSEKLEALQESQLAMAKAVARGGDPLEVTTAALRPVARRTRANAKRLIRESKPKKG